MSFFAMDEFEIGATLGIGGSVLTATATIFSIDSTNAGGMRLIFNGTGFNGTSSAWPTTGTITSVQIADNTGRVGITITNNLPTWATLYTTVIQPIEQKRAEVTWFSVIDQNLGEPISQTPTSIKLLNTDGTITEAVGTFNYDLDHDGPPTGTVTSLRHLQADGITVITSVVVNNRPLSEGIAVLFPASTEYWDLLANLLFAGNNTIDSDGLSANFDFAILEGYGGADTFVSSGQNTDALSYSNSANGVTIDLGSTPQVYNGGASAGTDLVTGTFNNVLGSQFNDTLRGNANANMLDGDEGDDILSGRGGNDTIFGGTGFDRLFGGGGNDSLIGGNGFVDGLGNVIAEGENGPQELWQGARAEYDQTNAGTAAGASINVTFNVGSTATVTGVNDANTINVDTLYQVHMIRGTNNVDTFSASVNYQGMFGANNEFEGMGGNDLITGNGATRISAIGLAASDPAQGVLIDFINASAAPGFSGIMQAINAADVAQIGTDSFTGVNQARGSNANDTIDASGVHGVVTLEGRGGSDQLIGSGFNDSTLDDFSEARFDFTTLGITVTRNAATTVTGGFAATDTDTLINIDSIRGTSLADTVTVNGTYSGPNGTLYNGFEGQGGNDTITGNGSTQLRYTRATDGVTVDLQSGQAFGTRAGDFASIGTDTFTGVNAVMGSNYGDSILGSNGVQAERFEGRNGNDVIDGRGGARDIADYRNSPGGIIVSLLTSTASDGHGTTDTLSNIEDVTGSDLNDAITGNGSDNYLFGRLGDDALNGDGGNDLLFGDFQPAGTSVYNFIFGNGTASGGGNDTLNGGLGSDTMVGGVGNDIYVVDNAGDVVTENSGEGTDTVQTALATYLIAANVDNLTFTDNGTHSGFGNALANVMTGGNGSDTLIGHDNIFDTVSDTLNGGGGNDIIYGEASDIIQGGAGQDFLYIVNSNPATINLGATGIEWIQTDFGNDVIDASTQTVGVEVYSDGGNDTITGSNQADIIWSGSANDTVTGGGGNDVIVADIGIDNISGGTGDDSLYIDSSDTVSGGDGFDAVYITGGTGMSINLSAATVEFLVDFVGGNDALDGSSLSVRMEAFATGGNDTVIGGSGNDFLWGGSGTDTVTGNNGNDTLVGETGADILTGGQGTDALYGNSGNGGDGASDTFVFANNWGTDFVFDYEDGVDKFNMSALGTNFGALSIIADGPHTRVVLGSDMFIIANTTISTIDATDFLF